MRSIATLMCGIALGFVLAHFINQNPRGRRFFDEVNQASQQLCDAVVQGYRQAG
jgi:ABC-type nitrate/sulfonate/bicarbonate transport system permease component